ncbi:BQ2448_5714 [Microbotryum intermedium]|uniref:BQ2448_5714 protein n=1 Tax=Microbotryum intermedium TaxID=269621 RepID=A0A238F7A4_9BASI|nr:BQ2448_5714 [Microbotryum intermedium]
MDFDDVVASSRTDGMSESYRSANEIFDDIDSNNAEPDRKLEPDVPAFFSKAPQIVGNKVSFDTIYRSALTTIADANQVVHDHIREMMASGKPLSTHVSFPGLHALKVQSGHSQGIGPVGAFGVGAATEWIWTSALKWSTFLSNKRPSSLGRGQLLPSPFLEWLDGVWVPWPAVKRLRRDGTEHSSRSARSD